MHLKKIDVGSKKKVIALAMAWQMVVMRVAYPGTSIYADHLDDNEVIETQIFLDEPLTKQIENEEHELEVFVSAPMQKTASEMYPEELVMELALMEPELTETEPIVAESAEDESEPIATETELVETEPEPAEMEPVAIESEPIATELVTTESKEVESVEEDSPAESADAEEDGRFEDSAADFNSDVDYYDSLMKEAALSGDYTAGRAAEASRNAIIDALGLRVAKIDFRDLYLLAKIITLEAGSDEVDNVWRKKVGEVLVNRVNSREFPNSFEECIHQPGQYYARDNKKWNRTLPNANSVDCAFALLLGERILNDKTVVYQANFKQGGGVADTLYHENYGYTYLCYTDRSEFYDD